MSGKFGSVLEPGQLSVEVKPSIDESGVELFQKQPAERAGQHTHWQKEAWTAGHPTLIIQRNSATWNDAMQVRMMQDSLAPCMENVEEADVRPEVLRVDSDSSQRLRRGSEQYIVNHRFVLKGDFSNGWRYREHNMEVWHRQQFCTRRSAN